MSERIPLLGQMVSEFCVQMGICTRCQARRPKIMHKYCQDCLTYKQQHKQTDKSKEYIRLKRKNRVWTKEERLANNKYQVDYRKNRANKGTNKGGSNG